MCAQRLPLFDPDKARGPRRGPDVGQDATAEFGTAGAARPISVSTLVGRIKGALADAFPQAVTVVGEISNLKVVASGHLYFRLKDAGAAIDAVMFKPHALRLKFRPHDGLEVVAEGRVDVYETRGQLQLYVERLTPRGAGALELAFRQLREKLRREGLFDPATKRQICRFPRAIGVITSATGAAIRDISRTLSRRCPAVTVYLLPVLVQGDRAAEDIAEALRLLDANARRFRIDTLIIARGGGSLEDLWAFNEQIVAQAIFEAHTPIITGIGHEADVTIADLAADVRAATPTAAAELAAPEAEEVRGYLSSLGGRLNRAVRKDITAGFLALEPVLRSVVFRDPVWRVRRQMQYLDELAHRLRAGLGEQLARGRRRVEPAASRLVRLHPAALRERAARRLEALRGRLAWALGSRSKRAGDELAALRARLSAAHPSHRLQLAAQRVASARRQLEAMSYRSVLKRGYSVTRDAEGKIIRSVKDTQKGELIETELVDGKIRSKVQDARRLSETAKAAPAQRAGAQKAEDDTEKKPSNQGPAPFD